MIGMAHRFDGELAQSAVGGNIQKSRGVLGGKMLQS